MRFLTGIQPSGIAHLGNLFGSMLPIVNQSKKGDTIIMVVDLHSLTTLHNREELKHNRKQLTLDLLALGFDTEKSILFEQSTVPAHPYAAWILNTITPMGMLERATSYKDKVAKGLEANAGLFTYPVLQTADILLYQADVVPVGKDQKQHLEIARDIAQKFNNTFGETFTVPDAQISEELGVIPGIDGQKMSKSYRNTIEIFASEQQLKKQIMQIETDSKDIDQPKKVDGSTICALYKLFATDAEYADFTSRFAAGGMGYGHAKTELFELANAFLAPLREARAEWEAQPEKVAQIMADGTARAAAIANTTLEDMKAKAGLG